MDVETELEKRRTLTRAEEYALGKMMEPVLIKIDDETAEYLEGWSDARIVQECGIPGINSSHVGRLRIDLFGRLNTVNNTNNPMAIAHERLKRLEARVSQLERERSPMLLSAHPRLDLNGSGQG